jgi:hypothetical protein
MQQNPLKTTRGSCHCGAVHWEFRGAIPDATICNCTVCRRYGVLWAYGYDGNDVHIEDPSSALTVYICGSQKISFNFCKRCGNLVSWRSLRPNDRGLTRIAVNLRLAEPADSLTSQPFQPMWRCIAACNHADSSLSPAEPERKQFSL